MVYVELAASGAHVINAVVGVMLVTVTFGGVGSHRVVNVLIGVAVPTISPQMAATSTS